MSSSSKRIQVFGDNKSPQTAVCLLGLPRPVITMCFSYLDMASGLSVAATCQACRNVCQSSKAWPDLLDFSDLPRNGVPLSTKTFQCLGSFSLQPIRLNLECENIPVDPLQRVLNRMQPTAVRICGASRWEMVADWKHFLLRTEKLKLVQCHMLLVSPLLEKVSTALTELDIANYLIRDCHLADVQAAATGLTSLNIENCIYLQCPVIPKTVTFLNVSRCMLEPQFWETHLPSSLKQLVMFNIGMQYLGHLDLKFLARLKVLTALDVSGNDLGFDNLAHICKADELQSLKCERLSCSEVQALSNCRLPLRELEMVSNDNDTFDLPSDFATFPKLQSLTICVTDGILPLRKLVQLTCLNLSFSPNLVGLSDLRHLPVLQTLKLGFCTSLEDQDLAGVPFPSITELDIQGCESLTSGLLPQLQLPKLKVLSANYMLLASGAALDCVACIKLSRLTLHDRGNSRAIVRAVRKGLRERKIAWWDSEYVYRSCHRLHSYLWSDADLGPQTIAENVYI